MPYEAYTAETRLDGVRIGVVRELFDKTMLTPAVHETVDLIDRALDRSRKHRRRGRRSRRRQHTARIVRAQVRPEARRSSCSRLKYPDLFPVDAAGKPGRRPHRHARRADTRSVQGARELLLHGAAARHSGRREQVLDEPVSRRARRRRHQDERRSRRQVQFPERSQLPGLQEHARHARQADVSRHVGPHARPLRRADHGHAVHGGDESRRAGLPHEQHAAREARGAEQQRAADADETSSSSLGRQGFPAITVPAGFTTEVYDVVVDPEAPKTPRATPAPSSSAPRPRGCPWASTSSGGRSTNRHCSGSRQPTRPRPTTAHRRRNSGP